MNKPVVIIGGGVIGLSIGWSLQRAGVPAIIFDKGRAGREASWLSAGMLAPETEMGFEDEALYVLGRESMRRWPGFVKDLEEDSGMSVDYRSNGILHVADDRDALEALRRHYDFQKELGLDVQWLSGAEARDVEPFIAPRLPGAVFSKTDHQVDNRLLVEALMAAFKKRGGKIVEDTAVQAVWTEGEVGVTIEGGDRVEAEYVVVAAGAWSRKIDGFTEEGKPAVRPVKGQMLQLKMQRPFDLQHVIWGRDAYLAPKSNGRLLVGATVEERGFDAQVTAGGLYSILEAAWRIVPGIYDLEVTETWAGLRPGSRDNYPILGDSELPGVLFATGHYRNGILLTPITGDEIAHRILRGETSEWLKPFSPSRFSHQHSIL